MYLITWVIRNKASHFPKLAVLDGKWVVPNPTIGSSKNWVLEIKTKISFPGDIASLNRFPYVPQNVFLEWRNCLFSDPKFFNKLPTVHAGPLSSYKMDSVKFFNDGPCLIKPFFCKIVRANRKIGVQILDNSYLFSRCGTNSQFWANMNSSNISISPIIFVQTQVNPPPPRHNNGFSHIPRKTVFGIVIHPPSPQNL